MVIKLLLLKKLLVMTKLWSILLFMNGAIWAALFKIAQVINTQPQDATTQAQSMMAQANRKIVPLANRHVATIDSHLRDFPRMNPPTLNGSKV